jgi:VRR-NUC domain
VTPFRPIVIRRMHQMALPWAGADHESHIVADILAVLAATGAVLVWRNNTGELRGVRFGLGVGSPDIVGILQGSGRFFGLEVKTPKGRISSAQRTWHARARAAGAFVDFARSTEEAVDALNRARHEEYLKTQV